MFLAMRGEAPQVASEGTPRAVSRGAPRVVVVGGGIGGVAVANGLARRGGFQVTLVSDNPYHVYQPGFLTVPFGQVKPDSLTRSLDRALHREVRVLPVAAVDLDPESGVVLLKDRTTVAYDWLVLAPGAAYDLSLVKGFEGGAHHFYSLEAGLELMSALRSFSGGDVVLGLTTVPFKCPVAPLQFVALLDDFLRRRRLGGRYRLHFLTPYPQLLGNKSVCEAYAPVLARRGVEIRTGFTVEAVDRRRRRVIAQEGDECPYDLLILVPPHRGTKFVREAGLGDRNGWIPTERDTLKVVGKPHLYALGDATDLPVSKTGASAHFQAEVVARNLAAEAAGAAPPYEYSGRVLCLSEVGGGRATMVSYDYDRPPMPPPPHRVLHLARSLLDAAYWRLIPTGLSPLHGLKRRRKVAGRSRW